MNLSAAKKSFNENPLMKGVGGTTVPGCLLFCPSFIKTSEGRRVAARQHAAEVAKVAKFGAWSFSL